MRNNQIKKLYELDWENERNSISNPHAVAGTVNDTIIHTQEIFDQICDEGSTILDLGCGDGKYHEQFFPNYNFIGIDYINKKFNEYKNNKYFIHDLNDIPYRCLQKKNFKYVMCIEVIEHLIRPDLFLEYIHDKILTKLGYLFLVTDNKDNLDDKINNIDISIYDPRLKQFTKNRWTHGHIRYFNVKSMYQLLDDVGFKILAIGGCGLSNSPIADKISEMNQKFFNIDRTRTLKALGHAIPQYSPSMYVLAQKITD